MEYSESYLRYVDVTVVIPHKNAMSLICLLFNVKPIN